VQHQNSNAANQNKGSQLTTDTHERLVSASRAANEMADETEQKEHEKNVKEDLGDSRGGNGNSGESEHRSNDRNHEKR
jgi:hypothetical protein